MKLILFGSLLLTLLTPCALAAQNSGALGGQWAAYRGDAKVADCEIIQRGDTLEFVVNRNPVERSQGRFLNSNTVIADDWNQQAKITQDGRRLDWGDSYWIRIDVLIGQWAAYQGGAKVADCEIIQRGETLEFVINRNPVERSKGRFLNSNTVIADDWKLQAKITENGRRLDWGSSYWIRVGGGVVVDPVGDSEIDQAPLLKLGGRWAAYQGGKWAADCEIIQHGETLEFIIKRDFPERSQGRFLNSNTVIADDWNQQAKITKNGRQLEWVSSYWQRVD